MIVLFCWKHAFNLFWTYANISNKNSFDIFLASPFLNHYLIFLNNVNNICKTIYTIAVPKAFLVLPYNIINQLSILFIRNINFALIEFVWWFEYFPLKVVVEGWEIIIVSLWLGYGTNVGVVLAVSEIVKRRFFDILARFFLVHEMRW